MKPALIRLFRSSWEVWEMGETPVRLSQSAEFPATVPRGSLLVLPARHVVASPLWADTGDADLVATAVSLQLELRGFAPQDVDSSRTLVVDGRTLVLCLLFPAELHLPPSSARSFEASPFTMALPDDALALWQEGPDIVAAFTRGPHVVHWMTFDQDEGTLLAPRLEAAMLQLTASGLLAARPRRVVLDSALENHPLHAAFPGATISPLESPRWPDTASSWQPPEVRDLERRHASRSRVKNIALALAALYLGLVSMAVLHLAILGFRENAARAQVASLEGEVDTLRPIMQQWRRVGPSAEPSRFPLEILLLLARHLPGDGLRLISYDMADGVVTVEGEAASASLATGFFDAVSGDQSLSSLNWSMPTPTLLPSSMARFQLSGSIP